MRKKIKNKPKKTTLTFQFTDKVIKTLEESQRKHNTTKIDIIRKALGLYTFLDKELIGRKDRKLAIISADGKIENLALIGFYI